MLRFGAKVPGPRARRPVGDHGLHLRLGVLRRLARRVRDADPRRAARRRVAVHPRRRGRGGLGIVDPIIERGPASRRPSSRTTTPARGATEADARSKLAGPDRRGGDGGRICADAAVTAATASIPPRRRADPALAARAHSIDGIERSWPGSGPSRTYHRDARRRRGRHVAARTSVMNLVVIARRPEVGERCAATIEDLTGRHPSRTLIVPPADPDGPSWLDAQIQAHCVLPREDAPGDLRRDDLPDRAAARRAGTWRDRRAAPHPRPAGHGLVAGRAAVREPSRPRRLRRWPIGSSSTARPGTATGLGQVRHLAALLQERRGSPSPTSRSSASRAGARRSPRSSTSPTSCPTSAISAGSRDVRRPRGEAAPGSTNVVKPVYHAAWLASRLGMRVVKPLAPSPARPVRRAARHAERRPARRRRSAEASGDAAGWRTDVAVVVRPVLSAMPPGTTLRVELHAECRGSELRADVTAEQRRVHVRVWQDGVMPSSAASARRAAATSTCWPRRSRPAGATRSRSGRRAWPPSWR